MNNSKATILYSKSYILFNLICVITYNQYLMLTFYNIIMYLKTMSVNNIPVSYSL